MNTHSLIVQIANAFPIEPKPTKGEILYEGAYPGESELEEIKEFFGDRPWNLISPGDVFRFRHALSFFSPAALAYYTPAWMTCCLSDKDAVDTAIENLVSILATANPHLWTQGQRLMICAWLIHFKEVPLKERFEQAMAKFECNAPSSN